MGGQIVDATVIEARRPRLTQADKGGGTLAEWKAARRVQISGDGRWTIKRGRKRGAARRRHKRQPEMAVPMFGYKNHVGIDREHGFLRRDVSHAAAHLLLGSALCCDIQDLWLNYRFFLILSNRSNVISYSDQMS